MGPTALRPIRRTKQWLSVLLIRTKVSRLGIRTHTLLIRNTRVWIRCSLPLGHDTSTKHSKSAFSSYIDLHDLEYQNSSTLISASWHGFTDLESYIDHYEWCVGRTPDSTDQSVLQCTDVGMQLSSSKMLEIPLTGGKFSVITIYCDWTSVIIFNFCTHAYPHVVHSAKFVLSFSSKFSFCFDEFRKQGFVFWEFIIYIGCFILFPLFWSNK